MSPLFASRKNVKNPLSFHDVDQMLQEFYYLFDLIIESYNFISGIENEIEINFLTGFDLSQ